MYLPVSLTEASSDDDRAGESLMISNLVSRVVSGHTALMRHCLWLLLIISTAKAQHTEFGWISVEQGLSFSHVSSIFQDSKGFMWFGTVSGLNKYDGYSFTVYRHDPRDSTSISLDYVISMYEDRSGVLWMITGMSELNRFDRVTEKFSTPFPQAKVTGIFEDESGTLWFATAGQGLLRLDKSSRNFRQYNHSQLDPVSMSNDTVLSFCEDRKGMTWVGTCGQLNSFDKSSGSFTHYDNGPGCRVYSIFEDDAVHGDFLWIGTDPGSTGMIGHSSHSNTTRIMKTFPEGGKRMMSARCMRTGKAYSGSARRRAWLSLTDRPGHSRTTRVKTLGGLKLNRSALFMKTDRARFGR